MFFLCQFVVARKKMPAFQSGCRLEDLAVPSQLLRRCFINNNTIRSLFYLFCFFVYLVASINKLELNKCRNSTSNFCKKKTTKYGKPYKNKITYRYRFNQSTLYKNKNIATVTAIILLETWNSQLKPNQLNTKWSAYNDNREHEYFITDFTC